MSYDPEDDDMPRPCYLPDGDDAPLEFEWHLPAYWWTWPYQREGEGETDSGRTRESDASRRAVAADVFSQQAVRMAQ